MTTDELNVHVTADTGSAASEIDKTAQSLENVQTAAEKASDSVTQFTDKVNTTSSAATQADKDVNGAASGISGIGDILTGISTILEGISWKINVFASAVQSAGTTASDSAGGMSVLNTASENVSAAMEYAALNADKLGSTLAAVSSPTAQTAADMEQLSSKLTEALSTIDKFSSNMDTAGETAAQAAQRIDEFSEKVNKIPSGNNVNDLAAAFGKLKSIVATIGLGAFIKSSEDAYVVQATNELKLAAHMRNRMNATKAEIDAIKELTAAQQREGIIGDEIQLAGAQQLTTFAKQANTLKTLIPAMNNLVAQQAGYDATASDAVSAANLLGKALQGQTTALTRMGITFTEGQEQIMKYGTEEQKAALLAKVIEDRVGNMNSILADTPTGRMKQLKNDLGDITEELGATFQPLISSVVPLIRDVANELKPVILSISTGISTVTAALADLNSPALRGIAYAAAAIGIIHKLRFALGGTATALLVLGGILAYIAGQAVGTEKTISDALSTGYDDADESVDGTKDGVDDLNDSLGKTKSMLAGFDTLTKLSGSSGGIISAADLEALEDYTQALEDANDIKNELSMDTGSDFINDAIKNWLPVWKTGLDTFEREVLPKWQTGIDTIARGWNGFWSNWQTGADTIGRIWEGFWSNWQTGADTIARYWDSFWSNWQTGWNTLVNGWNSFWDNWQTGIDAIARGIGNLSSAIGDIITDWVDGWQSIGSGLYELTHQDELNDQALKDKFSVAEYNNIVVEELKKGATSEEAKRKADLEYLNTSEAVYWYNNLVERNSRVTDSHIEAWRLNLMEQGEIAGNYTPEIDIGNNNSPPSRSEWLAGGTPQNISLYSTFVLDGEEISKGMSTFQQDQTTVTNGVY